MMPVTGNYTVVVKGEFGIELLDAFQGLDVTVERGRTTLRASHVDQAALHGILERAQGLGLVLLDVHREDEPA
jgi:hypothetical protein